MLAKALVFKCLETLCEYELDLNYYKSLPRFEACAKLEPLIYKKIDKKIANYSGCVNLGQAKFFAADFVLFFLNNYPLLQSDQPLIRLAKTMLKNKKLNKNDQALLAKYKQDFFCLYFLKCGRDYKEKLTLADDMALFMKEFFIK